MRFINIANLRVKECDRLSALATELCLIRPALAQEESDSLTVFGDPSLAAQNLPARIQIYADHLIAMAFALAALRISEITILYPRCVAKTYP